MGLAGKRQVRFLDGRFEPKPYLQRCLPIWWCVVFGGLVIAATWWPVLYAVRVSASEAGQAVLPFGLSPEPFIRALNESSLLYSFRNSLLVGLTAASLSALFGGGVALAAHIAGGRRLLALQILFLFPLVTPDVMIGLALGHAASEFSITPGIMVIGLAHSVFGSALVFYVVSAAYDKKVKGVIDAAMSLGVTQIRSLETILRPLVGSVLLGSVLVALVVSLDDFMVTYFLAQTGNLTFPVTIFNRLNRGLRPEHFAAATMFAALNGGVVLLVIKKFGLGILFAGGRKTNE